MRIKGRLAGITDAGLSIEKRRGAMFVARSDVQSIKLFPSRTHNYGNRRTAAILSAPIAFGSFFGSWMLCVLAGGVNGDEICNDAGPVTLASGSMVAVPWAIWRLARRADRGSIRIIFDKTTANPLPSGQGRTAGASGSFAATTRPSGR